MVLLRGCSARFRHRTVGIGRDGSVGGRVGEGDRGRGEGGGEQGGGLLGPRRWSKCLCELGRENICHNVIAHIYICTCIYTHVYICVYICVYN